MDANIFIHKNHSARCLNINRRFRNHANADKQQFQLIYQLITKKWMTYPFLEVHHAAIINKSNKILKGSLSSRAVALWKSGSEVDEIYIRSDFYPRGDGNIGSVWRHSRAVVNKGQTRFGVRSVSMRDFFSLSREDGFFRSCMVILQYLKGFSDFIV